MIYNDPALDIQIIHANRFSCWFSSLKPQKHQANIKEQAATKVNSSTASHQLCLGEKLHLNAPQKLLETSKRSVPAWAKNSSSILQQHLIPFSHKGDLNHANQLVISVVLEWLMKIWEECVSSLLVCFRFSRVFPLSNKLCSRFNKLN